MISMKSALFGTGTVLLLILGSGCLTYMEEPNASTTQTAPDFQGVNASDVGSEEDHIEAAGSMPSECKGNCTDCHNTHDHKSNISSSRLEQFCSQCHPQQFEEFSSHPGRHADLKCVYCHKVHRHIESCINCHPPHSTGLVYEDCLNCHPAHIPQETHEIEYPATVPNEQCAMCHKEANTSLAQGNTRHSSLKCAYCHTTHKQIPECVDCHAPHTQSMTYDDCSGCHPAHNPVDIKFSVDTAREDCAACHKEIDSELRGSDTKHNTLSCVYCHPEHRYLPTCESCHGLPHKNVYDVHTKYPDCSQCHIAPHEVNNIVFTRQ